MCNFEILCEYHTFNSLLQLEPLLSEQVGRVRFCSANRRFIFNTVKQEF